MTTRLIRDPANERVIRHLVWSIRVLPSTNTVPYPRQHGKYSFIRPSVPIHWAIMKTKSRHVFLGLAVSFMFMMSLEACQTPAVDPVASEGRRIYKEQCIVCHGPLGRGDGYVLFSPPVADLTSEGVQKKSDPELFKSIHQGRPNTAMGSWRLALSDEETWAVLQYVRQLGRSKGPAR